ncbi:MAG: hypothetical protein IPF64_10820 [Flavobacteriales bacterium]|nr:hypothetical protein [Flavobacteriales bacterium]
MNFSELTMSGQRFFGAGVELTPGHFRFAAMYGRLRKGDLSGYDELRAGGTRL